MSGIGDLRRSNRDSKPPELYEPTSQKKSLYVDYSSDEEESSIKYRKESCVDDILDDLELELSFELSQFMSKAQLNARKK